MRLMGYGISGWDWLAGDTACSTALVSAASRCLKLPFDFNLLTQGSAISFAAGTFFGSVCTLALTRLSAPRRGGESPGGVTVRVNQQVGGEYGPRSEGSWEGARRATQGEEHSEMPSDAGGRVPLRPVRRGAGSIA